MSRGGTIMWHGILHLPQRQPSGSPRLGTIHSYRDWGYETAPYAMGIIDIELAKSVEEVSGYPVVTYFTDFKAF